MSSSVAVDALHVFTEPRIEPSEDSETLDDLIRELDGVGGQEHEILPLPSPLLNRSPSCANLGEDVIDAVQEELQRKSGAGSHANGLTYREMRQRLRQWRYEKRLEEQRRSQQITCDCFSFFWRKSERIAPASPIAHKIGVGSRSAETPRRNATPAAKYSSAPALNQLTDFEPERAHSKASAPPALDASKLKVTDGGKSGDLTSLKESMKDLLKEKYMQKSDGPEPALAIITPPRQVFSPSNVKSVSGDDSMRRGSRDASSRGRQLSYGFTSPDSSRHSRSSSSSVVRTMAPRKLLAPVTPEEVTATRIRLAHAGARAGNSIAFGGSTYTPVRASEGLAPAPGGSPVSSPATSPDTSMRAQTADKFTRQQQRPQDASVRLAVSPDSSIRRGLSFDDAMPASPSLP